MNNSDLKLIGFIMLVVTIMFGLLLVFKNSSSKNALVYYEDNLVLTIDLNLSGEHEYKVMGYNGEVIIKTKDSKIKVEEENSPLNICSKQGWIKNSYDVIVCLPNKIVIKIEDKEEIDTVVR
ncbi:MAG: NusG domain II-containing protein [Firmicutes bacterium]|nr:NusG domain II-containing protein [Bacillota bacterium]